MIHNPEREHLTNRQIGRIMGGPMFGPTEFARFDLSLVLIR